MGDIATLAKVCRMHSFFAEMCHFHFVNLNSDQLIEKKDAFF